MHRVLKKFLWGSLSMLLIISCFIVYGKYYSTLSYGYRTGVLQKFSYNGQLIKTYEGEIILRNNSNNQDSTTNTEKFYFSVTRKSLANELDTIQGKTVMVHFEQKNDALFWNGNSQYIVDEVKLAP